MKNLTQIESCVNIIQSIIISIGIIAGFFLWKSQLLKGKRYEVARNLLQSVFALKAQLNKFRSPFVPPGETASALINQKIEPIENSEKYRNKASAAVFRERWQKVYEAFNEFELKKIEAKATLGIDIDLVTKNFETKLREINAANQMIINNYEKLATGQTGTLPLKILFDMEKIIYAGFNLDGKGDTFEEKTIESIKEIKDGLSDYLSLK